MFSSGTRLAHGIIYVVWERETKGRQQAIVTTISVASDDGRDGRDGEEWSVPFLSNIALLQQRNRLAVACNGGMSREAISANRRA